MCLIEEEIETETEYIKCQSCGGTFPEYDIDYIYQARFDINLCTDGCAEALRKLIALQKVLL
jgi:hypothetical protein